MLSSKKVLDTHVGMEMTGGSEFHDLIQELKLSDRMLGNKKESNSHCVVGFRGEI